MSSMAINVVVRFFFEGPLEAAQRMFDACESTPGLDVEGTDRPNEYFVPMSIEPVPGEGPSIRNVIGPVNEVLGVHIGPPEPCIRLLAVTELEPAPAPDSEQSLKELGLQDRLDGILLVLREVDSRRSQPPDAGRAAVHEITQAEYAEIYRYAQGGTPPESSDGKGI